MQHRMQKTLFRFCASKETKEESDDGLSSMENDTVSNRDTQSSAETFEEVPVACLAVIWGREKLVYRLVDIFHIWGMEIGI